MEQKKWEPGRLKKLFEKKNWLMLAGIAGILLIFLSDVLFGGADKKTKTQAQPAAQQTAESYSGEIEARLTALISSVEGAGKSSVMITLDTAGETVYAQDEKSDTQSQKGTDGVTQEKSTQENQHTMVDTDANGKQALVEVQRSPEIRGVAVVCEGGGDFNVVARVTELVSVVLGVPSNRICVTKMI